MTGSFLGAGAFEELEGDKPGSEKTEENAGDEDVKDQEEGCDEGNHAGLLLRLLDGFGGRLASRDTDAAAVGNAEDVTVAAGDGGFDLLLVRAEDALEVAAEIFFRRTAAQCFGQFLEIDDHACLREAAPRQSCAKRSGSKGSMRLFI
jgi:hypothetical protein